MMHVFEFLIKEKKYPLLEIFTDRDIVKISKDDYSVFTVSNRIYFHGEFKEQLKETLEPEGETSHLSPYYLTHNLLNEFYSFNRLNGNYTPEYKIAQIVDRYRFLKNNNELPEYLFWDESFINFEYEHVVCMEYDEFETGYDYIVEDTDAALTIYMELINNKINLSYGYSVEFWEFMNNKDDPEMNFKKLHQQWSIWCCVSEVFINYLFQNYKNCRI